MSRGIINPEPEGMLALRGKTVDHVQRRPAYEEPLIVCTDGTVVDTGSWQILKEAGVDTTIVASEAKD